MLAWNIARGGRRRYSPRSPAKQPIYTRANTAGDDRTSVRGTRHLAREHEFHTEPL